MGNLLSLLTTFHGRISRKPWWIGMLIVGVGGLFGTLLFNPELFTDPDLVPATWADTIWQLGWLLPATAISVKRFNDRDWPWWLGYVIAGFAVVSLVAPHFGLRVEPFDAGVGAVVFWLYAAAGLFASADNGFGRGTVGSNSYGPDPRAGSAQPT